jgi:hypothetical protein
MIQNLILKMINLLVETLAGEISNVAQQIRANAPPSPPTSPLIALIPGTFTIRQQPGEGTSTSPRPETYRQIIPVNKTSSSGSYVFAKPPLKGSVQCQMVFNPGQLSERQVWLQEEKDFTIDYNTHTATFTADLSQADRILFTYSFVSLFTLRDLEQDLLIDIYADDADTREKLAFLTAGAIITHHDSLIETCNQDPTYQSAYQSGSLETSYQLNRIQFLEGTPEDGTVAKIRLRFSVSGQLKATRALTEGFGLIEKIHSPDRPAAQGIDIAIVVE